MFIKIGLLVYRRRALVAILAIAAALACAAGFLRMRTVTRVEILYIPQNTQGMRDIDRASKHFPIKAKTEEFIIKPLHDKWALTEGVLRAAIRVHKGVLAISGFENICVKNGPQKCHSKGPLEIFGFDESRVTRVNVTLNAVYARDLLQSDGEPATENFPDYFARFRFDARTQQIVNAEAVRVVYYVHFPTNIEQHNINSDWESRYNDYLEEMAAELLKEDLQLFYTSGRSLDDSVSEASIGDVKLVVVSLLLIAVFCTLTMARFTDPVVGHFWLGVGGLLILTLGIAAGFGLIMLCGAPYVAFAGVLPFLVLGVGIDNMFIIVDSLDRRQNAPDDPDFTGARRLARTMGRVGASITMTTFTDLVAFGVSMVTTFPAIRYFCLYAAASITICYLLVISLFLAFVSYDLERIESGRKDFLFCSKAEPKSLVTSKDTISSKIMERFGHFLMKTWMKWSLLALSLPLLAGGVYGTLHIKQSFDMTDLGLKSSPYVKYYSYRNKVFPDGLPISVVIDTPVNYTDPTIQHQIAGLSEIPRQNSYLRNRSVNWMETYLDWSRQKGVSIEGVSFYLYLNAFLAENKQFYRDLKFHQVPRTNNISETDIKNQPSPKNSISPNLTPDNATNPTFMSSNSTIYIPTNLPSAMKNLPTIVASRVWMYSLDNGGSVFRKDMMLALREDLAKMRTESMQPYATTLWFIYVEQFVVILDDTVRNLAICSLAILLVTMPYLKQPKVTFLVFWGFVSLIFELLCMLYLWNISLNCISMIIIVMAIGFAVDYSAHVAHAFVVSEKPTPELRAVDALTTMGASVFMGGASTFFGVLVTAFATSEIFKIFFKMVFGIVLLGLLHGLVFLPVLLSIFCRTDYRNYNTKSGDGKGEKILEINGEKSANDEITTEL